MEHVRIRHHFLSLFFEQNSWIFLYFELHIMTFYFKYLFMYFDCTVLIVACEIFSCGMWNLVPRPRIKPKVPLHWERGLLATGPPGMSLCCFILAVEFPGPVCGSLWGHSSRFLSCRGWEQSTISSAGQGDVDVRSCGSNKVFQSVSDGNWLKRKLKKRKSEIGHWNTLDWTTLSWFF